MRRAPLLALTLLAVSCGGDGRDTVEAGGQSTTTTTASATTTTTVLGGEEPVTPATGDISLTVQVVSEGAPLRDATLVCGPDGVRGTGYLADPAAAQAACDLLTGNRRAVARLVEGREPGLMCTQQYGGPEVAKVTGTIGDRRVDVKIDRTDGCGIAEWNALIPLLGSPAT